MTRRARLADPDLDDFDVGGFEGSREELWKVIMGNVMFPAAAKWSGKRKASSFDQAAANVERSYVNEALLALLAVAYVVNYVYGSKVNKDVAQHW